MKIALYGATGTIGQRILNEALQRGHSVTAIVRDPAKLTRQENNLSVVTGDIDNPQSVAERVAGNDAILSAYGPSHDNVGTLLDATRSLIAGAKQAGVKRLVVIGGAGSLETAPGIELADTPDFPAAWKGIADAHREALTIYRNEAGDLDWTNVSPPALIAPGERTGTYRTGKNQLLVGDDGQSRISAEDYAVAFLDELEQPQHIKERFTVGY